MQKLEEEEREGMEGLRKSKGGRRSGEGVGDKKITNPFFRFFPSQFPPNYTVAGQGLILLTGRSAQYKNM